MEIDLTKLNIAQLYQVYGEMTLQLEILSQKHNQVKNFIAQKSNEMQQQKQASESQIAGAAMGGMLPSSSNGLTQEAV